MNIIKLKDIIMRDENAKLEDFYNKYLKGKYAWWIQMRYIVPFEFMRHEGYVACEEDITKLLLKDDNTFPKPYGCPYIDMYSEDRCIIKYIDHKITDDINDYSKFKLKNFMTPDEDLTLDMLKQFRSWLAQSLLDAICLGELYDTLQLDDFSIHTMKYYADNMYNDCVKYLSIIDNINLKPAFNNSTHCGCCETLSNTYKSNSIGTCKTLDIYINGIRYKMIDILSNIDIWKNMPKEFLKRFRQYIDNIIRLDLKINNNQIKDCVYITCACEDNLNHDNNKHILQSLLNSLDFMINDSLTGHYNYIKDSFNKWAHIYEYMQW